VYRRRANRGGPVWFGGVMTALRYRRALTTWAVAYVSVTIIGSGLFFLIAAVQHTGSTQDPLDDPSYVLEEKLLPVVNLVVWTALALAYFGKRHDFDGPTPYREALRLGALWLLVALPIDFVGFVVIKTDLSLSANDFYVGQFPWIYRLFDLDRAMPVLTGVRRA
jgi:hypothetical protein